MIEFFLAVFTFVNCYIIFVYEYKIIYKKNEINIFSKLHYVIILSIISYILRFDIQSIYTSALLNGCVSILTYFILIFIYEFKNQRIINLVFSTLVIWIINMFFELLLTIIFYFPFQNYSDIVNSTYKKTLMTILFQNITLIIFKIISINKSASVSFEIFKTQKKLVLFIIANIFAFSYFFINNDYSSQTQFLIIFILISFSIILLLLLKAIDKDEKHKNINYNLVMSEIKKNKEIEEYRMFKHNIFDALLGIQYKADTETKRAINIIMKKYNNMNKNIINTELTFENYIYYLIHQYAGINFKYDNQLKLDILKEIKRNEYVRFFETIGILLKNACESTIQTKEKLIYISTYKENEDIIISILNTFNGILELDKFGQYKYSTKKRNSGYGIFHVLKDNKNISFRIVNNMFCSKYICNTNNTR